MLTGLEDLLTMIVTTLQETSDHDHYAAAVEKTSFDGRYSASSVILTLSVALAFYNSLEMVLLIATTFRRWRGLYFWSLSICNLGVVLYTIGMMTTYFDLSVLWLSKVLNDAGWIGMVVCQSLVLYSRLGLILDSPNILRAVKWMILANSIVLVTTVVVLDFGTTYSASPSFAKGYFYIEHIQLIGFTIQETVISALYVWKAINLLEVISKANTRSMIWQLLIMNLVIIGMDIVVIILQFRHLQLYQESVKAFVYSVKLKLEVHILSKLVDLVHGSSANRSMTLDIIDSNAMPGQSLVEVQRERSQQEHLGSWLASDDKSTMKHLEESHTTERMLSASSSQPADVGDSILPTPSQPARHRASSTRESDFLYAEALRSLK